MLSALPRLYSGQGYKIEQATGAADALALMQTRALDLVISDRCMREMDGSAFLEAVRGRHPGTVRILLTGYADIALTVAAIKRGEIHRYVAKHWGDKRLRGHVAPAFVQKERADDNGHLQSNVIGQLALAGFGAAA